MTNERVNEARDAANQAADSARSEAPKVVDEAKGRARVAAGSASKGLEGAAGKLRNNAERIPGGERSTKIATRVAGGMDTAARKARKQSDPGMKGRAARFVKNNPAAIAVTAAVVGVVGIFVKKKVAGQEPAEDEPTEM